MATNELKVLGAWFSPFAMRVQIALKFKGLDYEFIEETLNPKSDLLLELNPVYKKIPVLIHEEKSICESSIIVEYIDEVWKNNNGTTSILPSNAYDRAIARFWGAYIDDKLFNSMRSGLIAHHQDDESKKTHFEQVEEVLVRLDNFLNEGKNFFGGDQIGYIDIAFGCYLSWLRTTEKFVGIKLLDETKTPSLAKWAEAFADDSNVKGILPETDKLLEFAKFIVQKWITPK